MNRLLLRWKIHCIAHGSRQIVKAQSVRCSVWWFGAYWADPKHLVFVIAVTSDVERDMLRSNVALNRALRELLIRFSWPEFARQHVIFDIESQETVSRETNGNWWYHYK
jgi:hypothetical protein